MKIKAASQLPVMVDACFNPECHKELRYLREGRIVRIVHGEGDSARLEHFWLCGPCSDLYEFVFEPEGSVTLKIRRPVTVAA